MKHCWTIDTLNIFLLICHLKLVALDGSLLICLVSIGELENSYTLHSQCIREARIPPGQRTFVNNTKVRSYIA